MVVLITIQNQIDNYYNVCPAGSNFYSNRVINDWNSLPQSIVDSPSVNEFKMLHMNLCNNNNNNKCDALIISSHNLLL